MDDEVRKAYDHLVPADQLVIDAMIVALYKKDKQIAECVRAVNEMMGEKGHG